MRAVIHRVGPLAGLTVALVADGWLDRPFSATWPLNCLRLTGSHHLLGRPGRLGVLPDTRPAQKPAV